MILVSEIPNRIYNKQKILFKPPDGVFTYSSRNRTQAKTSNTKPAQLKASSDCVKIHRRKRTESASQVNNIKQKKPDNINKMPIPNGR
jgi:hypothetical protein